jgi:hypothetical protein
MKKDVQLLFKNLTDKYKRKKRWKKIVSVLSCITIFVTMYFLMSPAITQTGTTYTFHLIDNYVGEKFNWKESSGFTTSYDLKLHYVDIYGNYIEGNDLTLKLDPNTQFKDDPYGFGYSPKSGEDYRGLDLISEFDLEEKITSNGDKYVFDHVEVLVNGSWQNFISDTGEHWNIWCQAASAEFDSSDICILCAAVADFRPETQADEKIKREKDDLIIRLKPTQDIAANLGSRKKENQILVGFALETNNEAENALGKLTRKNLDFIVLNSLKDANACFGYDTNKITIIEIGKIL